MADNDWKKRLGVVFSTNPDFQYTTQDTAAGTEAETLPAPSSQRLTVRIDRHSRAGKQVTLVQGFKGPEDALKELCRFLKVKLGVGGNSKDGEIVIQGDWRDKVCELLTKEGYNARRGN